MEDNSVCPAVDNANRSPLPSCQIDLDARDEHIIPSSSKTLSYRPHSTLARALYEKHLSDVHLVSLDKNQWYDCDLKEMPKTVSRRFIKLFFDEDTDDFLQRSIDKSDWIFTQLWHSLAKSLLSWFMTQTSINGFLGRGSMFVLSLPQFLKLLGVAPNWKRTSLLDLGAGDGEVTAKLAPAFEEVYVTEMCGMMQGMLMRKGFKLLGIDEWTYARKYDVISCLNLLDRCDSPISLLKQIKDSLKPGGLLLVALVLPVFQYVESGPADHEPTEKLPIDGTTFEQQVASVARDVFGPSGFKVVSWTRVPYLCEGDLKQCYYWLNDAVFVLKSKLKKR